MFSLIYISKFTLEFVCLCCYVFGEPMKSQQNVDTLSALFSSNRQFFSCTDDRLELLLFRLLLFYLDFLFQQVHITCRRKTRMMNSTSKAPQNLLLNNISYPNYQVFSVNSSTFKPNWKDIASSENFKFSQLGNFDPVFFHPGNQLRSSFYAKTLSIQIADNSSNNTPSKNLQIVEPNKV